MSKRPISRLRAAWLVLVGVLGAVLIAALLAPEPKVAEPGVVIALPSVPDGLAPRRGQDAPRPVAEDDGPLPVVVRGEAVPASGARAAMDAGAEEGPGEVVITIPDATPAIADAGPKPVPPAAPREELTRRTAAGTGPARGAGGTTPFAAYRRLQPAGEGKSVAVIVSGLGLDAALTARATALPAEVSLAFAPYARDLPAQIEAARAAGHEVLVELPMGTPAASGEALGPAALLTSRDAAGNAKRLDWLLTRAPAYPMVTNYLGRGFARDERAMGLVMDQLSRRGLAYVDDTGLAAGAARAAGVPNAATDLLIAPGGGAPGERLGALSSRAEPGKVALAKVYATDEAIVAVARWADALPRDVALVPASTAIEAR